jgi:hypothetical protein
MKWYAYWSIIVYDAVKVYWKQWTVAWFEPDFYALVCFTAIHSGFRVLSTCFVFSTIRLHMERFLVRLFPKVDFLDFPNCYLANLLGISKWRIRFLAACTGQEPKSSGINTGWFICSISYVHLYVIVHSLNHSCIRISRQKQMRL